MKLSSDYVACICEGSAEEAIVDTLLDNDKLIFTRDDMLDNEVIRSRSADNFQRKYLRKGFKGKITVIRILDSRRENFKLSKEYQNKIDFVNIVTAPEIEMLIIHSENKYKEYSKSHKKPSDFCRENLKMKKVKEYEFVKNYFSDVNVLINAITEYIRIANVKKGEYTLRDIMKE